MRKLGRKLADRLAAQVALLRARRLLATAPVGALAERRGADRAAAAAARAEPAPGEVARAESIADAVLWAARRGLFRPFCLVQSLALQDLLHQRGMHDSEIRVGVRREGNALKAHAWVRWNGQVLGDDPEHVSAFTEVDDIGVLGLR